jgi:hypothetical protein
MVGQHRAVVVVRLGRSAGGGPAITIGWGRSF